MSPALYWTRWGGLALLTLACTIGIYGLIVDVDHPVRKQLRDVATRYDRDLRFLRLAWTGKGLVTVQMYLGLGIATSGLLLDQPFVWLLLLPALVAPGQVLSRKRVERVRRIETSLDGLLQVLANNIRASGALGEALDASVRMVPPPMSEELDDMLKAYRLGTPLDEALDQMGVRVSSRVLQRTLLALRVARKTGGNLPETLETAAASLREMARLDGVLRTKTAEGKAQAAVISVMPLPLFAAVVLIEPGYFQPLIEVEIGRVVIGLVAALWLVAVVWIQRILAVEF